MPIKSIWPQENAPAAIPELFLGDSSGQPVANFIQANNDRLAQARALIMTSAFSGEIWLEHAEAAGFPVHVIATAENGKIEPQGLFIGMPSLDQPTAHDEWLRLRRILALDKGHTDRLVDTICTSWPHLVLVASPTLGSAEMIS